MKLYEFSERLPLDRFVRTLAPVGITRPVKAYEAVVASGVPTASGHTYSRADFIRARKRYFEVNPQQLQYRSADPLFVTIVDTFRADGTPRRDFSIFQAFDLYVVDPPNEKGTWYAVVRFSPIRQVYGFNPVMEMIAPALNNLHNTTAKVIPVGAGTVTEEDGVRWVRNYDLTSLMLVPDSGFTHANLTKMA